MHISSMKPTYEIIDSGKAIHCLICGMTSYSPMDVLHRFCGRCHRFHPIHSVTDPNPPDIMRYMWEIFGDPEQRQR